MILYNLRGEREVELCQSLVDARFSHFPVEKNLHLNMVTMIPYHQKLNVRVAFSPEEEIRHTLSETLSMHGLRQVKISESEKAVHVSFFLNGKIREPFPGEERIAVPTFRNEAFRWAMKGAMRDGTSFHLMGIVSFFSSHGSLDHLMALFKLAKLESVENLYHHAMLGRGGERKESGARYLEAIEKELENLQLGKVISVVGRYWSLDREENWDRIEKTYRMLVYGEGQKVSIGP